MRSWDIHLVQPSYFRGVETGPEEWSAKITEGWWQNQGRHLTPPASLLLDTLISLVELSLFQGIKDCPFPGSGRLMCQLVPAHSLFQAVVLLLIQGWVKKKDRCRTMSFVDFTKANKGVGERFMGLPLTGLLEISQVILTKILQDRY